MKKIKEWLEELPEPYRSEAIKNTQARMLDHIPEAHTLGEVLDVAFAWYNTPQGQKYWSNLRNSYETK